MTTENKLYELFFFHDSFNGEAGLGVSDRRNFFSKIYLYCSPISIQDIYELNFSLFFTTEIYRPSRASQDNCNECDFQATSKAEIIKHKNMKHRSRQDHEQGSFQCVNCKEQFSAKWNLQMHIRDNHEEKRADCLFYQQSRCNFLDNECWNAHRAKQIEVRGNREKFKCYSCHIMFKSKS